MSDKKGKGIMKFADHVEPAAVPAGESTSVRVLVGPDDGAANFSMRRFTMGDGGGIPLHTNSVEHEQYVLRGRAKITVGSELFDVEPGSVLYIPAGVPHSYAVLEAPFEFICVVPNAEDTIKMIGEC